MLARLRSAAVLGVEAYLIQVEVDVSCGLPMFNMVGLPDASVRESRDRVRTAIRNSGFEFPPNRITVNLAPADVRKAGSSFDLPIALGVLAASGAIERREIQDAVVLGELSLDGTIHSTRGVLPIAAASRRAHIPSIVLPVANAGEACIVDSLAVFPVDSLASAVNVLNSPSTAPLARRSDQPTIVPDEDVGDFADVRGQAFGRRALEVAAAGGHNVLLVGPPGGGKTMMARRMPGILPPLTFEEALESTSIHSVSGLLGARSGLLSTRPFRAPHHTISDIALIGGGSNPRPGEISLAHNGVLFLDEMPEFDRHVLEVLRQPLEEGRVTISRAARTVEFPARFVLVAAMNPCPCGFLGDPVRACRCTPQQVLRYRGRISGPMRDRLDLVVDIPAVRIQDLTDPADGEPSAAIRERVLQARLRQQARYAGIRIRTNADMHGRLLSRHCHVEPPARRLLHQAVARLSLSARGYDRVLKVSRTIADMRGSDSVTEADVGEALQYRLAV